MKLQLHSLWRFWVSFWFETSQEKLLALGWVRIVLTASLLAMAWDRQFYLAEFFTESGFIGKSQALSLMSETIRPAWVLSFWSDAALPWVHGFYVLGLLALMLGVGGRPLSLVLWFLSLAFVQRNWAVLSGADVIGALFLFYLSLTQSCSRLSVLSFFRARIIQPDWGTAVGVRLFQIQLCLIYSMSGFEKLKGLTWWDGTALWTVFANSQMVTFAMDWVRWIPELVVLLSWGTVLFEVFFVALVLSAKTRPWVLALGAFFHFGIAVVLGLWSFAFVMICPYFLFLPPALWSQNSKFSGWMLSFRRRWEQLRAT